MMADTNNDDPSELKPWGGEQKKYQTLRQQTKTKTKEPYSVELDFLEKYALSRATWEEARPIVDLLEIKWGLDPPPPVAAVIQRVKEKFSQLIYGPKIDSHDTIQGDKNSFESGADLNKLYMSQGISVQEAIKELTKQTNHGKRQRKRRSQCVPGRKHDGETVSDKLPQRSR